MWIILIRAKSFWKKIPVKELFHFQLGWKSLLVAQEKKSKAVISILFPSDRHHGEFLHWWGLRYARQVAPQLFDLHSEIKQMQFQLCFYGISKTALKRHFSLSSSTGKFRHSPRFSMICNSCRPLQVRHNQARITQHWYEATTAVLPFISIILCRWRKPCIFYSPHMFNQIILGASKFI